ncbi:MAG: cation diffusion facilitator family transporter [Desulfatirhabdiaceae bacterium]
MSGFSAAVSNKTKIRLLSITLGMELYTVGASTVGILTSNSMVFVANFVIALTGALASGLSLYTVRKMSRRVDLRNTFGFGRFETLSSIVVGITMVLAALFIGYETLMKIRHPVEQHGGLIAVLLTSVSCIISIWLWIHNLKLSRTEHSPIFGAMWRLARMGALEDFLIIGAVGISLAMAGAPWTRYLDVVATTILLMIMIRSIHDVFSGSIGDLLDRSLDEYNLIMILRELASAFDCYEQIHGFRTRRSGSHIFIELFLEFDGNKMISEVYALIDRLENGLKSSMPNAQVLVVPSRSPVEN